MKRKAWTPTDLRTLKKLARKAPVKKIAKALGRTTGATRQAATSRGISLDTR